jgi:hypothetical protein
MGTILGFFTSALSGGGLGVLGGLVQKLIDMYQSKVQADQEITNKKLDHQHELDMQEQGRMTMKLEAEAKLAVSRVEGDVTKATTDTNAMVAAMQSDKRTYATDESSNKYPFLMVLVDFLRGVIRPGLTIYLTIATSVIVAVASYHLHAEWVAGQVAAAEIKDLVQVSLIESIKTILFLFEMTVSFWFVTRPSSSSRGGDRA